MESVEYLGFLIEVASPETGTYEYSVFDMTGKDKPEFPIYETDDVGFVSYEAAVEDAKSWIRDFLIDDDERVAEHIENLYATKKALSHSQSVETTGIVTQKLTADVFNRPDCPEWAKWAAVDECGCVRLFSDSPWLGESCWNWSKGEVRQLFGVKFDASDWQKSRIKRPENENKLPEWCKVDAVGWHKRCGYFKVTYIDDVSKRVDIQQVEDKSKGYLSFHTVCNDVCQARPRPYNVAEMKALVGKVLKTSDGDLQLITAYYNDSERVLVGGLVDRSADEIKERYIQLDGMPCGKLVHKEGDKWVE